MLDVVHFRLDVEERLKGAAGLSKDGPARVGEPILWQVADRQICRSDDRAGIRLVESGKHLEQCRLAGAVRSAQTDTLAVANLPRHVLEQRPVAEGFGEI